MNLKVSRIGRTAPHRVRVALNKHSLYERLDGRIMADFRFGRQKQTGGMTDVQHLLAFLMTSVWILINKWDENNA